MDAVCSDHEICFNGHSARKGQLHATICFSGRRQAVVKVKSAFHLGRRRATSGNQHDEHCSFGYQSGRRRCADEFAERCPIYEPGYRRAYFLNTIRKVDLLKEQRSVRKRETPAPISRSSLACSKTVTLNPRPQGKRGRQAADPTADDGDLKFSDITPPSQGLPMPVAWQSCC